MQHLELLEGASSFSAKALQLQIDGQPHLVLGNQRKKHAELLEEMLRREQIPFTMITLFDGSGPAIQGERYELVGAGSAHYVPGRILLYGKSEGYNLPIDLEHIRALSPLLPDHVLEFKKIP